MIITPAKIQTAVCTYFGLDRDTFLEPDRTRQTARPRQVAFYLTRELTDLTWQAIGTAYCRDHTTIYAGRQRIAALVARIPYIAKVVDECRTLVLAQ